RDRGRTLMEFLQRGAAGYAHEGRNRPAKRPWPHAAPVSREPDCLPAGENLTWRHSHALASQRGLDWHSCREHRESDGTDGHPPAPQARPLTPALRVMSSGTYRNVQQYNAG